jgi:membrane-bound metal-dependent hydrolase YbcI (DUF457 family)
MVKIHMPSPLGHALAGVVASWCADLVPCRREWRTAAPNAPFFEQAGGALTAICAGLAVSPDIDLFLGGPHRSISHSVSAVLVITIIAAVVTAWVTDRPVWRAALMCGSAYSTHLLLDWSAVDGYFPYGVQLFWPFSRTWYISGLDLFPQTERWPIFSLRTLRIDLNAMMWETIVMMPIVTLVWLVRIKTLARLAPQIASRHHAS